MKKKLAILGLLAALLLLMGCASSRANVPYRVYLITKSTQTEFWKSVFAGAYAAKSEYNIDLTILGPETEEEFEIQNQYIAQAIANHADAIMTAFPNMPARQWHGPSTQAFSRVPATA